MAAQASDIPSYALTSSVVLPTLTSSELREDASMRFPHELEVTLPGLPAKLDSTVSSRRDVWWLCACRVKHTVGFCCTSERANQKKRKRLVRSLEDASHAARAWFESISSDSGEIEVEEPVCYPIEESSYLLGPIARLANRHNCLTVAQHKDIEVGSMQTGHEFRLKLVWGMEHGRAIDWTGLVDSGLRRDLVTLARITDHPAIRSKVVRGAVLAYARQRGAGGKAGWLCQHIESGIDPDEAERQYSGHSPGAASPSSSSSSPSVCSASSHTPVVLACLRHTDRVLRLAYRLSRAGRLESRLTRQSAAASSAEMLYGLPLPPVRGLSRRERGLLSPLPRTLRPDQNRTLAFLREVEHSGCVVREPPAAPPTMADLRTTESAESAFIVPLFSPGAEPRTAKGGEGSSSSSSEAAAADSANGSPSYLPRQSQVAEVRLWSSVSVRKQPALGEVFGQHHKNYFFRRIPFAHSTQLRGLRGSPGRPRTGGQRLQVEDDGAITSSLAGSAVYYNTVSPDHVEISSSIRRLWQYRRWTGGGICASEMGLGKTSVAVGLVYLDVVDPHRSSGTVLQSEHIATQINAPVVRALGNAAGSGEGVGFAQSQERQEDARRLAMARYVGLPSQSMDPEAAMERAVRFGDIPGGRMPMHSGGFGSHGVIDSKVLTAVTATVGAPELVLADSEDDDLDDNLSECSAEFHLADEGNTVPMWTLCKEAAKAAPRGKGRLSKSQSVSSAGSRQKSRSSPKSLVSSQSRSRLPPSQRSFSQAVELLNDSDEEEADAPSDGVGVIRPPGWSSTSPVTDKTIEIRGPVSITKVNRRNNLVQSRATLIVVDSVLLDQWIREIRATVGLRLRIHVYCGISQTGSLKPGTSMEAMMKQYQKMNRRGEQRSQEGVRQLQRQDSGRSSASVEMASGRPEGQTVSDAIADRFAQLSEATLSPVEMKELLQLRQLRTNKLLADGPHRFRLAQLECLAMCNSDIVLATYMTLRQEFALSTSARRSGRVKSDVQHAPPVTPLRRLEFRRMMIDEAQQVAQSSAGLGILMKMLTGIEAQKRWCVSATPLGDAALPAMFGLMRFLRHPILGNSRVWHDLAEPLLGLGSIDSSVEMLKYMVENCFYRQDQSAVEGLFLPRHTFMVRVQPTTAEREKIKELEDEARRVLEQVIRGQLSLQGKHTSGALMPAVPASGAGTGPGAGAGTHSAGSAAMEDDDEDEHAEAPAIGLKSIPAFAEHAGMPVQQAVRKLLSLRHKIAYARGGSNATQPQTQEELLRGIRIRYAQQHESVRRQLCWRWQHFAEALFRAAAGIRQVLPSEFLSLKDLTKSDWTVPRVALSAEGFLSSEPPERVPKMDPADLGCWLDAALLYDLGRGMVGEREAAAIARMLRLERNLSRGTESPIGLQLASATSRMPHEVSGRATRTTVLENGSMFSDLELGARQLVRLADAPGGAGASSHLKREFGFSEDGWNGMLMTAGKDMVANTYIPSYGDNALFAHEGFCTRHGLKQIDSRIDTCRQQLLSEISARVVAARVQQLRNADVEYADVRTSKSTAEDWKRQDDFDSIAGARMEAGDDSPESDDDVERSSAVPAGSKALRDTNGKSSSSAGPASSSSSPSNSQPQSVSDSVLEAALPFAAVRQRWVSRLRSSIGALKERGGAPRDGKREDIQSAGGAPASVSALRTVSSGGHDKRRQLYVGMHSAVSNAKDIADSKLDPIGPTVLRLHRGTIGGVPAADFWRALQQRKDQIDRLLALFDRIHGIFIHLQLLPRLLLIEKQADPASVLNAAETFIEPPTVLTHDMKHVTPDGRDGREDLWDPEWDTDEVPTQRKQTLPGGNGATAPEPLSAPNSSVGMAADSESESDDEMGSHPSSHTVPQSGGSPDTGKSGASMHPLCTEGRREDIDLRVDPRAYCVLAGVRAALQCYREAQDVEVDRETLEDEERGTLQWSLLEVRNAALLQAVARVSGKLDWQEECRRQKRRKVHLYVQTKARQLRKHFIMMQEQIKTAYGISSYFQSEEGNFDDSHEQVQMARPTIDSAAGGSGDEEEEESDSDGISFKGKAAVASKRASSSSSSHTLSASTRGAVTPKFPGVPVALHAWLSGKGGLTSATGELPGGQSRPIPADMKQACTALQKQLSSLAELTYTTVTSDLERAIQSLHAFDEGTRKWLAIELSVIRKRWALVQPGADRRMKVRDMAELQSANRSILNSAGQQLLALVASGNAPYPLSNTKPRLLGSLSMESLHQVRSHIDASRLQAGVLIGIRNSAAASYRELKKVCTGIDYVTDMCNILDPVSHSDVDSGRWDDSESLSNVGLLGLVREATAGLAGVGGSSSRRDASTSSSSSSSSSSQVARGGSSRRARTNPRQWSHLAGVVRNLQEIAGLEGRAAHTMSQKLEQDGKYALLQQTIRRSEGGEMSVDEAEKLALPICVISHEVPSDPAMAPCCGSMYSLRIVTEWLKKRRKDRLDCTCCTCRKPLSESMLVSLETSMFAEESGIYHVSHRNPQQQVQTLKATKNALLAQGKLDQGSARMEEEDDDLERASSEEEDSDSDSEGPGKGHPEVQAGGSQRYHPRRRYEADTAAATADTQQLLLDPRPGKMPPAPWQRRTQVPANLLQVANYVPPVDSATSNTEKTGDFMAKAAILVRRIKSLPVQEQAVVFVHTSDTAKVVLRALQASDVPAIGILGSEQQQRDSMRKFGNGSARVLVLDYQRGAKGLTLNQANNVFLLDSALPHTEAQAVSRVWRYGQLKQVNVFRVVVEDSMEERMLLAKDAAVDCPAPRALPVPGAVASDGAARGGGGEASAGSQRKALPEGFSLEPESSWKESPPVHLGEVEIKSIGDLSFIVGIGSRQEDEGK